MSTIVVLSELAFGAFLGTVITGALMTMPAGPPATSLAPVGEWFGLVESAYGLHLVRVLGHAEPRLPDFDELRDRLSTDYSFETRQAANALALERLTERYQIVFDDS